jgi:CHAT domain-containing protein
MDRSELVTRLVTSDAAERASLLDRYADLIDAELAWELRARFDEARTKDPAAAAAAAAAFAILGRLSDDPTVGALAAWTSGQSAVQIDGQPGPALVLLDEAASAFEALEQPELAANVQVARLHALALLGRYDEAMTCGLRARDTLLAHGDILTAGKIEQNLGSIYWRRDQYSAAEGFYQSARARFLALGDQRQLVQVDIGLANVRTSQYQLHAAAQIYEQALARSEAAQLEEMQAMIEGNLGWLALFQGAYNRALDHLERSRRRYAALGMPHESAVADLELADAYLELNLAPEAATIYARVIPMFAQLGMRAEQARAVAYAGYASLLRGKNDEARRLLSEAQELYAAEGNTVGVALIELAEAQLFYHQNQYADAAARAAAAEAPFVAAGALGKALVARWWRGEALRALGQPEQAAQLLSSALSDAESLALPQVAQRCHTSLGLLAAGVGERDQAERSFSRAVALIEGLRAPLPAEEFRTAFFTDKLTPYSKLVWLCLEAGSERVVEALTYVERARSRALVEMLGGALPTHPKPRDAFEAELLARLSNLREELNWLYNQISRTPERDEADSAAAMADLQAAVRQREIDMMEISRQLGQRSGDTSEALQQAVSADDIAHLQHELGNDTTLIEYFSLDGELIAFVVDDKGIVVVRGLGREEEVEALVEQLRSQTDTLGYGDEHMLLYLDQLARRTRHYLRALYDKLLRPIEARLGQRRLVVVPYRALHYVPFHALDDGEHYVIERREVCYAPSASVLRHCLARPHRPLRHALLLGVADEATPRVHDEIAALQPLFHDSIALLDEQATREALFTHAPGADVLHLACHGQFRPDNPLFSSLQLGDSWLTVYDVYMLDIDCGLVTLSACETGVSAVAPGDELIGLARGFFSTGAPSLLVSLWTADDESTASLMRAFYTRLRAGDRPAAALRQAQRLLLEQQSHPFFWSPFVVLGRW